MYVYILIPIYVWSRRSWFTTCFTKYFNNWCLISTTLHIHTPHIQDICFEKTEAAFINDAMTFVKGTIPQSIIVATVIGLFVV